MPHRRGTVGVPRTRRPLAVVMYDPAATPPLPAEYYRRHAARVRQLAGEATTAAIKEHLQGVAQQYERLAERVDDAAPRESENRA